MKKGIKNKTGINWKLLIISFIVVYSIGIIGSLFVYPKLNSDWYSSVRPVITPPDFVFPLVWNILFALLSLSIYTSLVRIENKKSRLIIETMFGVNLLLNLLWGFLYFFLQNPLFAFFDIILLWISILVLIIFLWKINKKSAWLLVPYALWVGFAGVLNYLSLLA